MSNNCDISSIHISVAFAYDRSIDALAVGCNTHDLAVRQQYPAGEHAGFPTHPHAGVTSSVRSFWAWPCFRWLCQQVKREEST